MKRTRTMGSSLAGRGLAAKPTFFAILAAWAVLLSGPALLTAQEPTATPAGAGATDAAVVAADAVPAPAGEAVVTPPAPVVEAVPAEPMPAEPMPATTPEAVATSPLGVAAGLVVRRGPDGVPLISLELNEEPLNSTIKLFANLGGVSIIASTNNTQTVSGSIKDAPWRPALESLLAQRDLRLNEHQPGSGVFTVEPKLAPESEPWVTESFKLSFLKSDEAAEMLRSLLGLVVATRATATPPAPAAAPGAPVIRDEGRVVSYPAGNVVVVSTTASRMKEVRDVLQAVDVTRPQVYVEAKIVQLTGDASKRTGIDWSMLAGYKMGIGGAVDEDGNLTPYVRGKRKTEIRERGSANYSGGEQSSAWDGRGNQVFSGTVDPTGASASPIDGIGGADDYATGTANPYASSVSATPGAIAVQGWNKSDGYWRAVNDIQTAVFSADALQVVLSALQTTADASVVSNPKLIVANEEKATIDMSTKDPYVAVSRETDGTGEDARVTITTELALIPGDNANLTYIEQAFFSYGIKVDVTPRVNNASNITVVIEPTISNRKEYYTPAGEGFTRYPVIDSRRVRTVFSLADGKTAMIGGLTTTSDVEVVKKIPILGDIPLIGKYLFSHTSKEKQQQETIIFVTVGIVSDSDSSAMSVPEASTLVQGVITPEGRLVSIEKAKQEQADKLRALERAEVMTPLGDETPPAPAPAVE